MQRLELENEVVSAAADHGRAMHTLLRDLFPLARSITGSGLRETVRRLSAVVPLQVLEVPSGTQVFDWTVPDEWFVEDAYIEDGRGQRIVDYRDSNLHVVGYSEPVDVVLPLSELKPHLHTLRDHPDWIPYRTSYYARTWGFCMADRVLAALPDGNYRAVIRSRLAPGSLTLAEHFHQGSSTDEILVFAHDCHPSLANDNLSGLVVATHLAAYLQNRPTRYTYRFVFAPATIGSIAWLATNESRLGRIRHGLVLSLLGSDGPLHYKSSRSGNRAIDRAAWQVLRTEFANARKLDFLPWGYDERQFCSPGINLPVGRLTRTPNGEFPEYHTSADNVDFVRPSALGEAWLACLRIFEALEGDCTYLNLSPKCEPQLGRRGLYRSTGGYRDVPERQLAQLWVLNQSDGSSTLLDIAERAGLPFRLIAHSARELAMVGLLQAIEPRANAGAPDGREC
jgi:aminopeptidase-like protein